MSLNDFRVPDNRENTGIVDGRPEGQQPPASTLTTDTIIDRDASTPTPLDTTAQFNGATSKDVHESIGRPGSDFTNSNFNGNGRNRNEGTGGRKRERQGTAQWGPPGVKEVDLNRAARETGVEEGASRRG